MQRTARFITPEGAQSKLHASADGKLPALQLHEPDQKEKAEKGGGGVHPLVLVAALALSVVLSIVLVLHDSNAPSGGLSDRKAEARRIIEERYFGDLGGERPLERYEELLRRAFVERERGDYAAERRIYREVLDMVRAEPGARPGGVTGSRTRDMELEQQLVILLGGR